MKYVSIDIETTGLDPEKHQIIEFAAVVADTETIGPVEDRHYCRLLIRHPKMDELTVGPYCAALHHNLWKEHIADLKNDPVSTGYLSHNLTGSIWVHHLATEFRRWLTRQNVEQTINPAGKNFSGFDRQFLNRIPNARELKFWHRTFDPASFFLNIEDKELPDMDLCLKRAGIDAQTDHTALADARYVVRLCEIGLGLRAKACGQPPEGWTCTRESGHEGPCAALRIYKSAILCEHANEMPNVCPCDADCYCKAHSCKEN